MDVKTEILHSAILNALMELTQTNKEVVVKAFDNAMGHLDCNHEICRNIGKDIAELISNEDWQELSNFLDFGHLERYN